MKLVNFLKNKYFKYVAITICYILWVLWVGNYWLLLGLPIIFDIYITKKVNWTRGKKEMELRIQEWLNGLMH